MSIISIATATPTSTTASLAATSHTFTFEHPPSRPTTSPLAPTPTFTNSHPCQSALSVFRSAREPALVASKGTTPIGPEATATVTPPATTPIPPILQFIQSHPMTKAPSGHPLAPTPKKASTKKASMRPLVNENAGAASADAGTEPAAAPPKRRPGRPHKSPLPEAPRCSRRRASRLHNAVEMRRRAKELENQHTAAEAEVKRKQAILNNPVGNHNLFITGARPKRAILATKHADGSDIIRQKKRTWQQMQEEEDARIVAALEANKANEESFLFFPSLPYPRASLQREALRCERNEKQRDRGRAASGSADPKRQEKTGVDPPEAWVRLNGARLALERGGKRGDHMQRPSTHTNTLGH
ncbi:hypothetical protein B0H19DRAFT_1066574 [Mycena capillaripes]|nr:hypothetical protein B0H19DRAFT_1066574 [Mycena capillaripes]